MAGAGPLEQGTEQHEQEDKTGGDPEGDAKHPLSGDPLVVSQRIEAHPTVGQQPRHPGAGQTIGEKHQGDDGQGRAEGTAGGLQQQRNADAGHGEIHGGQVAWPLGQLGIGEEQVAGDQGADDAEGDVGQWHPIPRRAAQGREHQIGEQDGKRQMDGAGLGIVEHPHPDHEGERRGDPELEQGPEQGEAGNDPAHAALRQAGTHVLGDQLFG